MNLKRILAVLSITAALVFVSSQAMASPIMVIDAKKTPAAKTPGEKATEKADERATKQAGKVHGKNENFKGTIAAVDAASLTLTLQDGSSVTIGLTAETRIHAASLKDATAEALQPGMTAMVQAVRDEGGNLTARSVHVIPSKPVRTHHVGWVTEYLPGVSITIQAHDGNTYTFLLTAETKILPAERAGQLAVGSRVTIIAPRDVASTSWTAQGIVVHPEGSGAGSLPATPASTLTPAPNP